MTKFFYIYEGNIILRQESDFSKFFDYTYRYKGLIGCQNLIHRVLFYFQKINILKLQINYEIHKKTKKCSKLLSFPLKNLTIVKLLCTRIDLG